MIDCSTSDRSTDSDELLRLARRKLRDKAGADADAAKQMKAPPTGWRRICGSAHFAFAGETVTQEDLAEHLKRIATTIAKARCATR